MNPDYAATAPNKLSRILVCQFSMDFPWFDFKCDLRKISQDEKLIVFRRHLYTNVPYSGSCGCGGLFRILKAVQQLDGHDQHGNCEEDPNCLFSLSDSNLGGPPTADGISNCKCNA